MEGKRCCSGAGIAFLRPLGLPDGQPSYFAGAPVSKPAYRTRTRHPSNGLNGGREHHGSVAVGIGRGSGGGSWSTGGCSDLLACCYGVGMEGLRCRHGILRGSSPCVCPVLRQPPRRGGVEG